LRYIKIVVLATAALVLAGVLAQPACAEVSFDFAFSNLSQHGTWLVSAQYGHVWQPSVYNRDWNPYYDGHWVYTDMGWAWVSDYEWGAIPYHYGTWVADPDSGWVWIPGHIWAPSWVVFRTGPDYIGWAPVPPGYSVGMTIEMGGPSSFVFVSSRDFLAPRIRMSLAPIERRAVYIDNTTVVNNIVIQNNIVVNRGPDFKTVARVTGRNIREERIESVARVAPFEHVSRAELAVDPGSSKQGVRVAEPVPASQPLPAINKNGNHQRYPAPAETSHSSNGNSGARPNAPPLAGPTTALPPSSPADTSRKAHRPKTPPGQDKAQADQGAQAEANAPMKAAQSAEAQANAKAKAAQNAQAQTNAKSHADQNAKAQANAKARADQGAQAQTNAKAKADAKAKKKHSGKPPAKDQTP